MIEIECPSCNEIGKISLVQQIYEGPYRCWKCRCLFSIVIANKKLQSCEPLSEEEYKKWQEERDALKGQAGA